MNILVFVSGTLLGF